MFREEVMIAYPELEESLNQLAGMITEEKMQEMNYQEDENDEISREYFIQEGLLNE